MSNSLNEVEQNIVIVAKINYFPVPSGWTIYFAQPCSMSDNFLINIRFFNIPSAQIARFLAIALYIRVGCAVTLPTLTARILILASYNESKQSV